MRLTGELYAAYVRMYLWSTGPSHIFASPSSFRSTLLVISFMTSVLVVGVHSSQKLESVRSSIVVEYSFQLVSVIVRSNIPVLGIVLDLEWPPM